MKLSVLAAIMAEVKIQNQDKVLEDFEVWNPHMFSDGEWSCDVVFPKHVGGERLMRLFSLLYANNCNWFFLKIMDDIAIDIQ